MSTPSQPPVRVNALRHGLTGRTVLLPSDDLDLYRAHVKSVTAGLNPEGPEETQLAALIADAYWRLNRIQSIEDGLFARRFALDGPPLATHPRADTALVHAEAYLAHSRELERLTLYEARIHRSLRHAAARLETLQKARRAARAGALRDAVLDFRHSPPASRTPAPVRIGGFEFSSAEIARAARLEDHLKQLPRHPKSLARAA